MDKRIHILVGHYGSGKTTIALNLAFKWSEQLEEEIALADLDVNNPYFRTRDWMDKLKEKRIQLVIPDEKIAFAEMPFLPKDIYSAINNENKKLIIDLGGHDIGTKVLGSLADKISHYPYELWMVINTYRPEMETKDDIINMFKRLETFSNLKITGVINNTNIGKHTEVDDILHGQNVILEAIKELNVPFLGNSVEESLVPIAKDYLNHKILPIKRFDLLNW